MELILPYLEAESFKQGLLRDYGFKQKDFFNASLLEMPDDMGSGRLALFSKRNFHFFRGTWNFAEKTIFHSVHRVGYNDMMDFRINTAGKISSNFINGESHFEHDTTTVDGMRIFLPKSIFFKDKGLLKQKLENADRNFLNKDQLDSIFGMAFDNTQHCLLLESKILEFLSYWIFYMQSDGEDFEIKRAFEQKIKCAKEFVDAHIFNEVTIKEISLYCGMNSCDLKKGFKQYMKLPIRQYIIKSRMERARRMLTTTEKSVGEIGDLIGYTNRGHFSQLYLRFFGKLPSEDRS